MSTIGVVALAEDIVRTACFNFERAWWSKGDLTPHLVELQCAIDDAIELLADVHA